MEPTTDLTRAIRALTTAIVAMCALQLLQLGLYGWGFVNSLRYSRQVESSVSRTTVSHTPMVTPTPEPSLSGDLPPEELVARSSALMFITYIPDGKRYKAMVAEIVKRSPDVLVYYSVGDEYKMLSYTPKQGESCGEGQAVFMVGSPAEMRLSYSFSDGRIQGLGGMPLEQLRALMKSRGTAASPGKHG